MEYTLLVVVCVFVIFTAWREREARDERQEAAQAHREQVSELLTRIAHPELVVVPDDPSRKISAPDVDAEQDDFAMVGTIVPGVPE